MDGWIDIDDGHHVSFISICPLLTGALFRPAVCQLVHSYNRPCQERDVVHTKGKPSKQPTETSAQPVQPTSQ